MPCQSESSLMVNDEESLYRGVFNSPDVKQYVPDKKGGYRVTSVAFTSPDNKLSVDIASRTTPEKSIERLPKSTGLTSFKAIIPKNLGHPVVEDPLPKNPAHALVLGLNKTKKHRRKIANSCSWAIPPKY